MRSVLPMNILSLATFYITYILLCCVVNRRAQPSHIGIRTRVAPVKAEYPNQLDYMGYVTVLPLASPGIEPGLLVSKTSVLTIRR